MLILTMFAESRLPLSLKSTCLAILLLVASMFVSEAQSHVTDSADLQAFVRDGCPHCQEAERFLALLQRKKPDLRISVRNIHQGPQALAELK